MERQKIEFCKIYSYPTSVKSTGQKLTFPAAMAELDDNDIENT